MWEWTGRAMAGLKYPTTRTSLGRKLVRNWARAGSWTHWHAQSPALGEVLMEEPGQLLWQDTDPAGKHKKHDRKQPRKGHGKLHTGIQLVRPEGGQDQAETVYVIHWQIQAPVWVDPGSVATKTSAQYGMPR